MQVRRLGPLAATLCGGTDRKGGGDGPVVVLLHGFGAPGDDLVSLWRVLRAPEKTRFVFPEAPLDFDTGFGVGRAWWMIDMMRFERAARGEIARRELTHSIPEGMASAGQKLTGMLDAIETELGAPPSRIALGGFSQGAMLSLDVALRSGKKFAGLVLMSGSIVAFDEWDPLLPRLAKTRVFMSHGEQDPILPFAVATELKDHLTRAGAEVTWHGFRGQHEIPAAVVDACGTFLTKSFA